MSILLLYCIFTWVYSLTHQIVYHFINGISEHKKGTLAVIFITVLFAPVFVPARLGIIAAYNDLEEEAKTEAELKDFINDLEVVDDKLKDLIKKFKPDHPKGEKSTENEQHIPETKQLHNIPQV